MMHFHSITPDGHSTVSIIGATDLLGSGMDGLKCNVFQQRKSEFSSQLKSKRNTFLQQLTYTFATSQTSLIGR